MVDIIFDMDKNGRPIQLFSPPPKMKSYLELGALSEESFLNFPKNNLAALNKHSHPSDILYLKAILGNSLFFLFLLRIVSLAKASSLLQKIVGPDQEKIAAACRDLRDVPPIQYKMTYTSVPVSYVYPRTTSNSTYAGIY